MTEGYKELLGALQAVTAERDALRKALESVAAAARADFVALAGQRHDQLQRTFDERDAAMAERDSLRAERDRMREALLALFEEHTDCASCDACEPARRLLPESVGGHLKD